MEYYSKQINQLIQAFSSLPGIGTKSAQRLAFHVINMPEEQVKEGVDKITEATSGTAQIQVSDPFYYGMDGKELVLF